MDHDSRSLTVAARPEEREDHNRQNDAGFVTHARLIAALTILSRVTGLVRDAVLAAAFGLTGVSDAFFIGFLIPNLFRRLFGEGALTAAFIPHYTELLKRDPALARRFASVCIALLAVLLAALTLLGEAALFALDHAKTWSAHSALAIHLAMIMLPYMPLICTVALLGGLLQVHRRFGPPAAAPVILNLTVIAFTVTAAAGLWGTGVTGGAGGAGVSGGAGGSQSATAVAVIAAIGVLVAGVLQLLWQLTALRRSTALTISFFGTGKSLASMLIMMLPMLLGLAVFQINAFFDSLIAFGLSPKTAGATHFVVFGHAIAYPVQAGAVAALQWSQRLYQFPLGVFGIAIATAIFPALSHAAAGGRPGEATRGGNDGSQFDRIFRQGLRLTMFVALPASIGLVMVRLPLARVVYERYAFSFADAQRVSTILLGYAVSVWAYSLAGVVTRAFYARKDANTPLKISMVMVGFNLVLNLILIWPMGAAGLAWSTSITAAIQIVWLLHAVRRHVDTPLNSEVWRSWRRSAALTIAMAAALTPMLYLWNPATLTGWECGALLAAMVLLGMAVVIIGAYITRTDELRWLLRRKP